MLHLIGRGMPYEALSLACKGLQNLIRMALLWQILEASLQPGQLGINLVSGLHGGMVGLGRDGRVSLS